MTERKAKAKDSKSKAEGAPKSETPETKRSEDVPKDAPRDEEAPLETPEDPVAQTERVVVHLDGRAVAEVVTRLSVRGDLPQVSREELVRGIFGAKPPKPTTPTPATTEVTELFKHVADNPVDSHAPVWTARAPNTTGGYS